MLMVNVLERVTKMQVRAKEESKNIETDNLVGNLADGVRIQQIGWAARLR
jgi:hypothetical protein